MKKLIGLMILAGLFAGCKKNDGGPDGGADGPGDGHSNVPAGGGNAIYYDWADEGVLKVDILTGVKSVAIAHNIDQNGWNISRDGQRILISADDPDDYDAEQYTFMHLNDQTVISQFKKETGYANHTWPILSPDESLIAAPPTYDDGITILDKQGRVLHNLTSYQGRDIENKQIAWMPDNTLLFVVGNSLCRTNQAFTSASVVTTFNFNEWADITVSMDGQKIALKGGNHIWMMNADGSNLVQITQSDAVEVQPAFSPDGNWLVLGTNYHTTGPFGAIWNYKIIPADGQRYNVNDDADARVIPIIPKGESSVEAGSGNVEWR